MNILVCDDSKIARKSIIRHLDTSSHLKVFQAENGQLALEMLATHPIDLLFLDLTMPVLDGFGVLAALPVNTYPTKVIVVSADIQSQAQRRCIELGASAFLDKPFAPMELAVLLDDYLIPSSKVEPVQRLPLSQVDIIANIKEMSNVALGTSASLISEQVGQFIEMPIPNVASLHQSELKMTVQDIVDHSEYRAVSQRFVGHGINGEALVCLHGDGLSQLAQVYGGSDHNSGNDQNSTSEIILDLANLTVSSFLVSFSKQLDISISLRQPIILEKEQLQESLGCNQFLSGYDKDIFTIEFVYKSEDIDLACDVIFLMHNESLNAIGDILETVL
ncbi:response regulator [Vibrio sp. 99-70-13A1]|uniref:response regulator n=1 Tax=Vibrio sp. 99-70-13A1 TaxID=2607601 RepID=UPI001493D456|nr:response regulator [Vibrio sp. 99-70-13A1]NOH95785.1 response regulator [Vibrio sp. 99-70-13A1]